ncbi:hypothetical protein N9362_00080 [bacterium]|nr:hypothetical protein [bacterium]
MRFGTGITATLRGNAALRLLRLLLAALRLLRLLLAALAALRLLRLQLAAPAPCPRRIQHFRRGEGLDVHIWRLHPPSHQHRVHAAPLC